MTRDSNATDPFTACRKLPRMPLSALVDFDEPEPLEEFDDDDIDDEDDERNSWTDSIGSK